MVRKSAKPKFSSPKASRPAIDKTVLGRWDKALAALGRLRQKALRHSLHSQRIQLAQQAWQLAGPLFDELEPVANGNEVANGLLEGLDKALMGVLDDPFAGRPLADELPRERPRGRPRRGDAQPCCMTLIRFRNLLAVPARVTASGALGTTATRVFRPGERRALRRTEQREGQDDDAADGAGGGGITIPGGLGRCVTVKVEIQNGLGEWVEIMSREVCCDTHAVGDILRTTPPPPPPGATTRERESPVLEIIALVAERPCPEGRAQLAPNGGWGHEFRESPSLDVPGKGHFIGAHVFLLYVPPAACRQFCFIQAVKRTVKLDGRDIASRDWRLDLLPGQARRPGCYAYQRDRPEGGRLLNDSPGLVNPWGAIRLEDGRVIRPRPGQRIVATWEFRTWAVCLRPPSILGQFSWTLRVDVVVPAGPPPQGGQIPGVDIDLTGPEFKTDKQMPKADKDLFDQLTH